VLLSVTAKTSPVFCVSRTSSLASASVVASGLSQMTSIPFSRKACATGKCRWFGVTMTTASMPSGRAASRAAISRKSW